MKNSELIDQLLKLDLDAEIVVWTDQDDGMGDSYNDYNSLNSIGVKQLYQHKDYPKWIEDAPGTNFNPENFIVFY